MSKRSERRQKVATKIWSNTIVNIADEEVYRDVPA
jgi:hypothetical protein